MAVRVHWFQKEPDLNEWEYEFTGLSTDEKPQDERVAVNSLFLELDTGDFYYLKSHASETVLFEQTLDDLSYDENAGIYFGRIESTFAAPETVTIIWDGAEYEMERNEYRGYYFYGEIAEGNPAFGTYPFVITVVPLGVTVATNTNPPHTVKIAVVAQGAVWEKVGTGGGNTPTGELLYEGTLSDGELYAGGYEYIINPSYFYPVYSSIIVEYNGTQYTLNNYSERSGVFIFGATDEGGDYDFSQYPIRIVCGSHDPTFVACQDENPTIKVWANSDPVEEDEGDDPIGGGGDPFS